MVSVVARSERLYTRQQVVERLLGACADDAMAEVVWRSWRDIMLAQARPVAPPRDAWETLPQRDRALDGYVALRVLLEAWRSAFSEDGL